MIIPVENLSVSGATFSPDRLHRYVLWRKWGSDTSKGMVMFVGLNPSTADEVKSDPTVTRCINYAKAWGYDGMFMTNLFAYRATDPRLMKAFHSPIGTMNNEALLVAAERSALRVCAWGNHGKHMGRSVEVFNMLISRFELTYLKMNRSGEPSHPLYLKGDLTPTLWEW